MKGTYSSELNAINHPCLFVYRYAQIYKTACTPKSENPQELTSEVVNADLAKWEPTYDYGTDSVFSISPPKVSPEDEYIYETSCRVTENGPSATLDENFYTEYLKQWS